MSTPILRRRVAESPPFSKSPKKRYASFSVTVFKSLFLNLVKSYKVDVARLAFKKRNQTVGVFFVAVFTAYQGVLENVSSSRFPKVVFAGFKYLRNRVFLATGIVRARPSSVVWCRDMVKLTGICASASA